MTVEQFNKDVQRDIDSIMSHCDKINDKQYCEEIFGTDEINFAEKEIECERCYEFFPESEIEVTSDNHSYCLKCYEKQSERSSQEIYDSLSDYEKSDWDSRAAGGWQ